MMNRIWSRISYLGLKSFDKNLFNRNIIIANRINFFIICLLLLLNVLTYINREISNGPYTIHTKVLLILLLICFLNVLFSYKTWHNLTKVNLIVFPSLIIVFLPIFYGNVQESDFIDAPIVIIGLSFIPQLILIPKLNNSLYLISSFYFLILVSFLDNILVYYSP